MLRFQICNVSKFAQVSSVLAQRTWTLSSLIGYVTPKQPWS